MRKVMLFAALVVLTLTGFNAVAQKFKGKKVLYVDSYHAGYPWSDGIEKGLKKILDPAGVTLKVVRMDTKRNTSADFMKTAALKAKKEIDAFKPDVVVASDDNASKYLVMPYYKDAKTPFVFCGVNWDAKVYGYPYKNATGMIEVAPIDQLVKHLKQFAKGDKIGLLTSDVATERKESENCKKVLKLKMDDVYVKTMDEWKKAFLKMQDKVDMIILSNNAGINDWKDEEIEKFVLANAKIPSGTVYDWMMKYAMIGFNKIAMEQGEWAAQTALAILGGKKPMDIPIAKNQKGELIINTKIAKKINADIPYELIESATKVIE